MFQRLMEIIDEEVCGGGAEPEQGASLLNAPLLPLSFPFNRTEAFYPAAHFGFWHFKDQSEHGQTNEMWLHIPTKQCIHPTDILME